jgi:hypothetical protein
MLQNKNIVRLSLILLVAIIVLLFTGCLENTDSHTVTTAIDYKTFTLKSDDINVRYFKQPLYTFEYPPEFNLADENLSNMPHIYSDQTRIYFTIQQYHIPESQLTITVQTPGQLEYKNAQGKFEYTRSLFSTADDLSTKQIKVSGISSFYLKAFLSHGDSEYYSKYKSSHRYSIFDYKGLIWEISLVWVYQDTEPLEVQQYFNHIIETFKILN